MRMTSAQNPRAGPRPAVLKRYYNCLHYIRTFFICKVKNSSAKFRQKQSFVALKHHPHGPAVDKQQQRAALQVADLLHI